MNFGLQLAPWGSLKSLFGCFSSLGRPWGPERPQDPPKSLWDSPGLNCYGFWLIVIDLFNDFGAPFGELFHHLSITEVGWERVLMKMSGNPTALRASPATVPGLIDNGLCG